MSLEREIAFDVLGLPTFASEKEILHKYRHLALLWFPERYNNNQYAVEQFRQVNEAASLLLNAGKSSDEPMNLLDMYELFQNLFLKDSDSNPSTYDYDDDYDDDDDALSLESFNTAGGGLIEEKKELAAETAQQLIQEEEQEKLKTQRRRAKKKRRKERKKQEKLETETSKKPSSESKKSSHEQNENKTFQDGEVSDSEEALDPGSAFVAVIAKKQKRLQSMESKLEKALNPVAPPKVKEDSTSLMLKSRELAVQANKLANLEMFHEAIKLFSESIKLDPSDHRFYGNRSYCYERLNQFDQALKDAEKSIALCPLWPKGYFRKGRALLGLKKFAGAEECFIEVLKLDNDCQDAISELHSVKVLQIMEMGYSKQEAETALAQHSSVQESIESLISSQSSSTKVREEEEVFVSDDENELEVQFQKVKSSSQHVLQVENSDLSGTRTLFPNVHTSSHTGISAERGGLLGAQAQLQKGTSSDYDIKMDPNNPENHNSLWIGNVQPDVTEKEITSMFSKHGELLSVKVMTDRHCAFVNYKNKRAPGKAMLAYQGLLLHGKNIVIRFPNLPGESGSKKKPGVVSEAPKSKQPEECYYWRTTGCIYGENCRNLHVKENKGIDKKAWHKLFAKRMLRGAQGQALQPETTVTESKVEPVEKVFVKEVKSEPIMSVPVKSAPFKSAPKTKLFVGNLPDGCSDEHLRTLFSTCGKVTECDVVGSHGFVHMATAEQAQLAVEKLNNYNLKGWYISVVPSKSTLHPTPGAPGRANKQTVMRSPFRR